MKEIIPHSYTSYAEHSAKERESNESDERRGKLFIMMEEIFIKFQ
jgi:hypothetical protein